MTPAENRFESDPDQLVEQHPLPPGWTVGVPDPADRFDVARLTHLLRAHERHGRGWAASGVDDVLVEVSEHGLRTRENVVVRDADGEIRAWGSVHDRSVGRMLFVHIVERDLPDDAADACSEVLFDWAAGQARAVGAARGLEAAGEPPDRRAGPRGRARRGSAAESAARRSADSKSRSPKDRNSPLNSPQNIDPQSQAAYDPEPAHDPLDSFPTCAILHAFCTLFYPPALTPGPKS